MNRLPGTVDDLRGLRAARWIRESTTGQFDRYGPEAQVELQNAAIERLGLADTGLEWRIAHSGRTVYRSPAMATMLDAAAAGAFDVLLVRIPSNSPGHSALNSPPHSRVLAHPSEAAPAADAKRQFIP